MSAPGHDAEFTVSDFGGGWIVPTTDRAREALAEHYGEPPVALAPLGGALGYIVEPHEVEDVAELFRALQYQVQL